MIFIRRKKVDEDVEKIRAYTESTLDPEGFAKTEQKREKAEEKDRRQHDKAVEDFTAKDVFAMSLAVWETIVPIILLAFGAAALIIWLFLR